MVPVYPRAGRQHHPGVHPPPGRLLQRLLPVQHRPGGGGRGTPVAHPRRVGQRLCPVFPPGRLRRRLPPGPAGRQQDPGGYAPRPAQPDFRPGPGLGQLPPRRVRLGDRLYPGRGVGGRDRRLHRQQIPGAYLLPGYLYVHHRGRHPLRGHAGPGDGQHHRVRDQPVPGAAAGGLLQLAHHRPLQLYAGDLRPLFEMRHCGRGAYPPHRGVPLRLLCLLSRVSLLSGLHELPDHPHGYRCPGGILRAHPGCADPGRHGGPGDHGFPGLRRPRQYLLYLSETAE